MTLDGEPGAPGELDDGYAVPNELPLHTEVLRARPDVEAVVHAHPADTVAADLAGLALRPIVGAFDIPGAHLAAGGVPVYPRAVLLRTARSPPRWSRRWATGPSSSCAATASRPPRRCPRRCCAPAASTPSPGS